MTLTDIVDEAEVELPVAEAEESLEFIGNSVESWYDANHHPLVCWNAWCQGIGQTTGKSRKHAIEGIKAKIVWSRPTLPIIHINGSGRHLDEGAEKVIEAATWLYNLHYKSGLSSEDELLVYSFISAVRAYTKAHTAHFKRPQDREHGNTHRLLNDGTPSTQEFAQVPVTQEFKKVLKAIRSLLDALKQWEFNQRDYYPIEGSWELARKERQALFEMGTRLKDGMLEARMFARK